MKKKIFLAIFLLLILVANFSLANYETVIMEVVEEPVASIKITENTGFEKKLISKDLTNKTVTLQLKINNEEEIIPTSGEVMLVLDNSESMNTFIDENEETTRKDLMYDSTKQLISSLLKDNDNLKIGIVSFSSNKDVESEGAIEDANLISELTNSADALNTAISNIEADGPRTNLQAGLRIASENFSSEDNNKYIIILSDGVPNLSLEFSSTTEDYYSTNVINRTHQELLDLNSKGINIITMLTGVNGEDKSSPLHEDPKTFDEIISEIFGTPTTPTVGKFYNIQDDSIEETITKTIYNDLAPILKTLKDITIVDYFPKEIIDNFDFDYVANPNIGEISSKVDTTNNSITWTIPKLQPGETAIVQYTLKLKEDFSSDIVEKILDTNEKVDISYTDFDETKKSPSTDVTPKLKLSEPPAVLPKAGSYSIFALTAVSLGVLVYCGIKLRNLNI